MVLDKYLLTSHAATRQYLILPVDLLDKVQKREI